MWVITTFFETGFTMYEFDSKDKAVNFMRKIKEPKVLTEIIT